MKKLFLALILTLPLVSLADAQTGIATSMGLTSGNRQIVTGQGVLTGVLVLTDGTNPGVIACYQGTTNKGNVLFQATVPGAANFGGATFEIPVAFGGGLYCEGSGTGSTYIIYIR
jgi:hypothetical protein